MSKFVEPLETDYLVIGLGAMGMEFADTLLTESQASVIFVDRHDRPGGHWNDAYPLVRLHAASANYGLNSTPLGEDTIDQVGLNRGIRSKSI
jgi:cation diffusion facilitator CzcD-associated flavoprotein CzcO